jgi:dihydropteroate synthase
MQKSSKNIVLKWSSPHSRKLPDSADTPIVMGVLNVSRDSFSDGGKYLEIDSALAHCQRMIFGGAKIIDIGAESTKPTATPISADEELSLLLPHLKEIRNAFPDIAISVDTYKPDVARVAIENGADIINDVQTKCENGFCQMAKLASTLSCPMIATHNSRDENFVGDFFENLKNGICERLQCLKNSGLSENQIIIDAGVGFGKSRDENFEIVARLSELRCLGLPILLGVSRKSMFADFTGDDMQLRDFATATISAIATLSGSADILRVHNVDATITSIKTTNEILKWTK